jgi:hypothetical protein
VTRGLKATEERFFVKDDKGKPVSYRRRLTFVQGDTAVTGALLTFAVTSNSITSCTEWADLAASFQQYRIRAIKARLVPRTRDNMNSAALIWYPGALISGSFPSGSSASTPSAMYAEDGSKVHPEWSIAEHMCTWESNPDAKLWTDCVSGVPAALSQFGVQFIGTVGAPLAYNGLVTHDIFVDYDVEFLGRN